MSKDAVFGDGYSRYYDLLYRDKDYAGEAQFVMGLLKEYAPGAKSILELGSGSGRHAALLAEGGYRVQGVEMSASMLEKAEARRRELPETVASGLSFDKGDIRYYEPQRTFGAVVSLFHVMSYQVGNKDFLEAVATAAAALEPGGVFLFDCWYGPCVLTEPPEVRIKRLEDEHTKITRLCEPDLHSAENAVTVNYEMFVEDKASGEVSTFAESHRMRYLFTPEVEAFLAASGLELVASGQWMSRRKPDTHTFSVYFVARKV